MELRGLFVKDLLDDQKIIQRANLPTVNRGYTLAPRTIASLAAQKLWSARRTCDISRTGHGPADTTQCSPCGLEQEPGAMLGLVDPVLDQAGGSDVVMLVTKRVYASQAGRQLPIIFSKFHEHVLGGNMLPVVIGDALKPDDLPDRM
jgi:hypothetical protein